MNIYGQPLAANSTQTILPALTKDGRVRGWYPIAQTTFDGTEVAFTLPDMDVPLSTVTVDSTSGLKQFMAAVWPADLPWNEFPWASASLVSPSDGYYRWWSLPTSTWFLHFGNGLFLDSLSSSLDRAGAAALPAPGAPTVSTPKTLNWQASVEYAALNGNCSFFDFNWVQLFTSTGETVPLRIEILTSPAPIGTATTPPLLGRVIGIPTAIGKDSVLYDTIRVVKNADTIPPGTYTFTCAIYGETGLSANVTLNIVVA